MPSTCVHHIEELQALVRADRAAAGAGASALHRYPVRFVLFDDFAACHAFVEWVQGEGAAFTALDTLVDAAYPDLLPTYTTLAQFVRTHVRRTAGQLSVLMPFSELARFYDNRPSAATFDALIATVSAIEAPRPGQRVYIPLVGLQGKMAHFAGDPKITLWRLSAANCSPQPDTMPQQTAAACRMVLCPDAACYGVQGVERRCTVVHDVREWLRLWRDTEREAGRDIVCTSPSLAANAAYAQPDNAFTFCRPQHVADFLGREGLQLDLGGMAYDEADDAHWRELAAHINVAQPLSHDDLRSFVATHFGMLRIACAAELLQAWFAHPAPADRWLLTAWYGVATQGKGFAAECLAALCAGDEEARYSSRALFTTMALRLPEAPAAIAERRACLTTAAAHGVALTVEAELRLTGYLENLAKQRGHHTAARYLSPLTRAERRLAVAWAGRGLISAREAAAACPDLAAYMQPQPPCADAALAWTAEYLDAYKRDKIAGGTPREAAALLQAHSATPAEEEAWRQRLKTTRTLLAGRKDIDVVYWVDGLGADWIPFVEQIVRSHEREGVYLWRTMTARAVLPTTTAVNRAEIEALAADLGGAHVEKCGDLDGMAHRGGRGYPDYILDEMAEVRRAVEAVLNKYAGRTVAIVSDHGLTWLAQGAAGRNLGGITGHHHGRYATTAGTVSDDNCFVRLDDGATLCAIGHDALTEKVPAGQGAHGGALPEEVLVPVFVVAPHREERTWEAALTTDEISTAAPCVEMTVRGLPDGETPTLRYHDRRYAMTATGAGRWRSQPLTPCTDDGVIVLCVGSDERTYNIRWNTGATEEDLFGF